MVVHIQDRHIDPVTQKNIALIIENLNVGYNIHLMCLEGASKELDTSFYDRFEDAPLKEKVAQLFVEKGLFTGPEFYKITNKENYLRAVGAEDKDTYLAHLACYKNNQVNKGEVVSLLNSMSQEIGALKKRVYSKDLQALDIISNSYLEKQTNLAEYASNLKKYAEISSVGMEVYDNLNKFIQLTEEENGIDFKEAEIERTALIKYLSENLKKEQAQELLQLSLDFRLNKASDIVFHDYLESLIAEYGLNNADYKNLAAYTEYLRFSKTINHLKVFDEADDLEEMVQIALCSNTIQKNLVKYSKSVSMLKDLYNLKLTNRHLDYIDEHPGSFDIVNIQKFLNNTSANYGLNTLLADNAISLNKEALDNSREFYRLALKRDIALTNNILKHMKQYRKDKAILVTGGFHTQGITNILKEKGISYVVICPTIGLDDCEKIYEQRMAGKLPSVEEIVAPLKSTLSLPLTTGDIHITSAAETKRLFKACLAHQKKVSIALPLSTRETYTIGMQAEALLSELKASSSGRATSGLPARSFYDFVPVKTKLGQEVLDYRISKDKKEIVKSLKRNNWYYQTTDNTEQNIIVDRAFNTLSDTAIEQIKKIIADRMSKDGYEISEESILSIMLYGSWAYGFLADHIPTDLDLAVIVQGDMPVKSFPDVKIPNTIFNQTVTPAEIADIRIIGTKQLFSELNEKERRTIHFETSMQGHGILLWGRDFFPSEPVIHNLMIIARTSLAVIEFYLDVRFASIYRSEEYLNIVERRIGEADRIFKVIFSNLGEPKKPSEQGQVPVSKAIEDMRRIVLDIRQKTYKYSYEDFSKVLAAEIMPHLQALYQQTETEFMEEQLEALDKDAQSEKLIKASSGGIGRTIRVMQHEYESLSHGSADRLQALLGVCIAVVAFNQKTGESRFSHFFPVVPVISLSDVVKWKQAYMKRLIGDIKGDEWNVAVIGSDTDLEVFSEDFKVTSEDLYGYLQKQAVNNIHLDPIFTTKIVYLDSSGKVTIILNAYGDIQYAIDLSAQKPFLDGGITVADIVKNIALRGNQTSAFVFSWLNTERALELEQIIKGLDRPDVLLSDDARLNMPDILASFVIRKALADADHLRPFGMSHKASSAGTKVLSNELYVNTGKVIDSNIKPLYDPLSYFGFGRITLITNTRLFTELDKKHLIALAKQNTGLSDDDPKKITIIAVYDEAKAVLKECGFTDTGDRPSVSGVDDFSSLADSLSRSWDSIDKDEQIAMVAAYVRTQNKFIITITDDTAAQGIASIIPAYLNDRMKGRVVIASMRGAEQKTQIGVDTIEENGIFFSAILANAVKEIGMQLIENTDQQLFILAALPPINSKEFEAFIQNLMDIKTAIDAAASAA